MQQCNNQSMYQLKSFHNQSKTFLKYLHFIGSLKSIKMDSNITTNEQEAVECDLCQNTVSFFCRCCGVSLCDYCVLHHLRFSSKVGHDVVDFTKKDDGECSVFCKTCDLPNCEHKLHDLSELLKKNEEVFKNIAEENIRLQSFKHESEAPFDPAQIQKFLKREAKEIKEGLTRICLFFSILFIFTAFFSLLKIIRDG